MLPVEFHSFLNADYVWPSEIVEICDTLSQPILLPPDWDQAPVPKSFRPILDELSSLNLSIRRAPTEENSTPQRPHLGHVWTLVLSTVAIVSRHGSSRSLLNIFIRGLAYACSKDAALLTDATFVRPRREVDDRGFDGQALFLACHIVENIQQERDSRPSMEVDQGEQSGPSEVFYPRQTDSDSGGYIRNRFGFKIPLSPPPPSIAVSLDGHIFQGCGKHTWAALPFLGVADEENICDLMSSVAYQRFVWGITEPAVGFLLSSTSPVATLFLSWVDLHTKILHIAFDELENSASASVFDFSDVHSTLRFAQFVLNLTPRFSAVAERGTPLCENKKLDWRSDNPKSVDPGPYRKRVERWIHDVHSSFNTLDPNTHSPTPPCTSSCTASCEESTEDMSTYPGYPLRKQSPTIRSLQASERAEAVNVESQTGSAASALTIKYRSNSEFAGLPAYGNREDGGADTLSWMLDRGVSQIAFFNHPVVSDVAEMGDKITSAAEDIDKHFEAVQRMCMFQWPAEWDETRPTVDDILKPVLDLLLKQADQKIAASKAALKAAALKAAAEKSSSPAANLRKGQSDKLKKLDKEVDKKLQLDNKLTAYLQERLSHALYACIGAHTLYQIHFKKGVEVNEAESRHDWDALLYGFYVAEGEITSPNVLLEESIYLARNPIVDRIKHNEDVREYYKTKLGENGQICEMDYSIARAASQKQLGVAVLKQAIAAWEQARDLHFDWAAFDEEKDIKDVLERHDVQEPRDGKCDATLIAAIPVPDNFPVASLDDVSFFVDAYGKPRAPAQIAIAGSKGSPGTELASLPSAPSVEVTGDRKHSKWKKIRSAVEDLFSGTAEFEPVPPLLETFPDFNKTKTIIFPHVLVEYKKTNQSDVCVALNQGLLYLVSVITYYYELGIEDRPFYCLVADGHKGALIIGWRSSKLEKIFVFDRNVMTFDLSSPIDVFHFVTIVLRLRKDQEELKTAINDKLKKFKTKADWAQLKQWRKSEQTPKGQTPKELS